MVLALGILGLHPTVELLRLSYEKWKYLGKPKHPWTQTPQEYEKIRRLEESRRPQGFLSYPLEQFAKDLKTEKEKKQEEAEMTKEAIRRRRDHPQCLRSVPVYWNSKK